MKKGVFMSIFRPTTYSEEKAERHQLIHYVFKTRFFVPFIKIADKMLTKFLIKRLEDIPEEIYNKNARILWNCFDLGIRDWYYNFYRGYRNGVIDEQQFNKLAKVWNEDPDKTGLIKSMMLKIFQVKKKKINSWVNYERQDWYVIPHFFIKLLLTIYLEDTAYREVTNCLLFRIQGEMNKEYNPSVKHKFPMYINMFDGFTQYFIEFIKVAGGGKVLIDVSAEDQPKVKIDPKEKKSTLPFTKKTVDMVYDLPDNQRDTFLAKLDLFSRRMLVETLEKKGLGTAGTAPPDKR